MPLGLFLILSDKEGIKSGEINLISSEPPPPVKREEEGEKEEEGEEEGEEEEGGFDPNPFSNLGSAVSGAFNAVIAPSTESLPEKEEEAGTSSTALADGLEKKEETDKEGEAPKAGLFLTIGEYCKRSLWRWRDSPLC